MFDFYLKNNKTVLILFTEQDYDEQALTAWNDSMVHASDLAGFSDSESVGDSGLLHEIPQPVFRDRDLNRSLDYDILNRVNRYFERLFDLADQRLIYRQVEEATVNAQADVFAILTNIIECQQHYTDALRYAADFWRQCHYDLYGEFIQLQQRTEVLAADMRLLITEQNLTVNALSLISERLNVIQRMLAEYLFRRE